MTKRKASGAGQGRTVRRKVREGGCLCALVRYRVQGEPLYVIHCHCIHCRRASGAPFVTWAAFRSKELVFTKMQPARFDSSSRAERSFCDHCGTPLTFQYKARPSIISVTVCSLDAPEQLKPGANTWISNQLPWTPLDGGLRSYEGDLEHE
jgi:hypothetical protein